MVVVVLVGVRIRVVCLTKLNTRNNNTEIYMYYVYDIYIKGIECNQSCQCNKYRIILRKINNYLTLLSSSKT